MSSSCFLCASGHGLDLGQKIAKLGVVDFHAIIQVEAYTSVRVVAQFLVEGLKFRLLFEEFVLFLFQPFAM